LKLSFEDRLKAFQDDPQKRLAKAGVAKGMQVADLGAGRGFYSLLSAGIVGATGVVYSVEPDSSRTEVITRRAAEERIDNIKVMATGAEDLSGIPSSSIDLAFALNSLHHFRDKQIAFSEVSRVLKNGGRFYIKDMIWHWYSWHGTRREDIANLPSAGFSEKTVTVSGSTLEASFTK